MTKHTKAFFRGLGILISSSLVFTGLTFVNAPAALAEDTNISEDSSPQDEVIEAPLFEEFEKNEDSSELEIKLDADLSETDSVLSIYENDNPVAVERLSSGVEFSLPAEEGVEYKATLGDQTIYSNRVSSGPIVTTPARLTISASFADNGQNQANKLYASLSESLGVYAVNYFYLVNVDTGEALLQNQRTIYEHTNSYEWPLYIPKELYGEYAIYIPKVPYLVSHVDQFEEVYAISNTFKYFPPKWEIGHDYTAANYSDGSTRVKYNFYRNFAYGSYYTTYLVNKKTGEIKAKLPGHRLEFKSVNPITLKPDETVDDYAFYLAKDDGYAEGIRSDTTLSDLTEIQAISTTTIPTVGMPSHYNSNSALIGGVNPSKSDCSQECHGDPINSFTGDYFENQTEMSIDGTQTLAVTRSYSNMAKDSLGSFGYGSTSNYDMKLSGNKSTLSDSDVLVLKQENGSLITFHKNTDNSGYTDLSNSNVDLSYNNNGYAVKRENNSVYNFDSLGQLKSTVDPNNKETQVSYDNGKVSKIISSEGKEITFEWANNLITSLSNGTQSVAYSYENQRLKDVIDSAGINSKSFTYDSNGLVETITNANGGVYSNVYDSKNRVIKQTNPLGGETSFAYQESIGNRNVEVTLPNGFKSKEFYNSKGDLKSRTLNFGTSQAVNFTYTYDISGNLITETNPLPTKYTYDEKGNRTSIKDYLGRVTRFTYNENNQIVETINALGQVSTNVYDSNGNLVETTSFAGRTLKNEVASDGRLLSSESPNSVENSLNKKTSLEYNSYGFVNKTQRTDGSSQQIITDNLGKPLSMTDSLNRVTAYEYDPATQLLEKVVTPTGAEASIEYDEAGRIVSKTNALSQIETFTYDLMDNLLTHTDSTGTTSYQYDNVQKLTKVINPDGGEISYGYDSLGRVISITDPLGNISKKEYHTNSLLKADVDPTGKKTTYAYDNVGNLIDTRDSYGNLYKNTYDKLNRVIKTTHPNGYYEDYTYDADGLLLSVKKSGKDLTTNSYDKNGNLTKVTYPDLSFEERTYDSEDNLTSFKDRDGLVTNYSYDTEGQLLSETKADGTKLSYSYNTLGSIDKISHDNWATIHEEYTYNPAGQLLSTVKDSKETVYSYNEDGSVSSRGPPNTPSVSYEYDEYGAVSKISYPSGLELDYNYDLNGNILSVKSNNESLVDYSYDSRGNQTLAEYANSTKESQTYDDNSRLTKISVNNPSSLIYEKQLTLNSIGFIAQAKTLTGTTTLENKTLTYSTTDILTRSKNNITNVNNNYNINSSYNLVSSPWSTATVSNSGKVNSATIDGKLTNYTYDDRGNRTQKSTTGTNSVVEEYSWTPDNKLENFKKTVGDVETSIDYSYGTGGLLESKTVTGEQTEAFVWDILSGVPALLEDDDYSYLYGNESYPFAQISKETGEISYLHGDERGSISATSNDTGELSWIRIYDEYGKTFNQSNYSSAQIETNFAYAGEYLDEDTNLYNLRARWYEPATGSFISQDPAILSTGEGYSYASGNPLTYTDPLGLWSWGDTMSSVAGVVDGFSPIPFAGDLMNKISPGSVSKCSTAYKISTGVGTVASFFTPGLGAAKAAVTIGGLAVYGAVKFAPKVVSVAKKAGTFAKSALNKSASNNRFNENEALLKDMKMLLSKRAPDNEASLKKELEILTKETPTNNSVRLVDTENDVLKLWDALKVNGGAAKAYNKNGINFIEHTLSDGTRMTLRDTSVTNSWTIDIVYPSSIKMKIHY